MSPKKEDFVNHCAATRLRVEGSGNLDLVLYGLSAVKSQTLVPLVMSSPEDKSKDKLANFKSERIQLEFSVDEIDEWFEISKIAIYIKPVASMYPG